MMNAYTVVAEFKLDIGKALLESESLQREFGRISNAAEATLNGIQSVSLSIFSQLGMGYMSVTGFIMSAVQASEKFAQSQRNLANIFLSNKDKTGISTFGQAMFQADQVMGNVQHKAASFALDPNALLEQAKAIAPMLISHGLDDNSMSRSLDISRGLLKSAPTLGVDPGFLGGQLINLVMGNADMNNTLFQRLMSETAPFKDNKITGSKQYNALPSEKRIKILTDALLQFGTNSEVIAGNVNSLNGQLTIFKNLVYGQFSIFKEIGTEISNLIKNVLKEANTFLQEKGPKISKAVADLIRQFASDPIKAFTQLSQLKDLKSDAGKSAKVMGVLGIIEGINFVYEQFFKKNKKETVAFLKDTESMGKALRRLFDQYSGVAMNFVTKTRANIAQNGLMMTTFAGMWVTFRKIFTVANFQTALSWVGRAFRTVLGPIAVFLFYFQAFSRGLAIAKVNNLIAWKDTAEKWAEGMSKIVRALRAIFAPIEICLDAMAQFFAIILDVSFAIRIGADALGGLASILELVGKAVVGLISMFSGLLGFVFEAVRIVAQLDFTGLEKNLTQEFENGFFDIWDRYFPRDGKLDGKDQALAQSNININKVEINNEFKEQMEPDRIAFSIQSQLVKAANNPSQGSGRLKAAWGDS